MQKRPELSVRRSAWIRDAGGNALFLYEPDPWNVFVNQPEMRIQRDLLQVSGHPHNPREWLLSIRLPLQQSVSDHHMARFRNIALPDAGPDGSVDSRPDTNGIRSCPLRGKPSFAPG
jgi:hypothetical protein